MNIYSLRVHKNNFCLYRIIRGSINILYTIHINMHYLEFISKINIHIQTNSVFLKILIELLKVLFQIIYFLYMVQLQTLSLLRKIWLEKILVSAVGSTIGDRRRLQDHILVIGSHFTCRDRSSVTSNRMNTEFKVDPEVQTMEKGLSSSCASNFLMKLVIDVNLSEKNL